MTPNQRLIYFALVIIKVILGLVFINRLSIDLDEPFSIFHAQKDLSALNTIFVDENNPPLHFWLLHFWIKIFGIEPWAVRSLSLLFSVLTLPVLLKIGQYIRNAETGLWFILLFVFSNFHHSFGIEARAYSLFSFLFSIAILILLKSTQVKNWKNAFVFGVILSLLFYTHYMAILVIPVILAVYLFYGIRNQLKVNLIQSVLAFVVFLVLSLPVIIPFVKRLNHVAQAGTWVPRPHWTELYGFINKFMNGPGFIVVFIVFILVLLYNKKIELKSLFYNILSEKVGVVLMLCFGVYLGSFVVSSFASGSVFLDRYMYFVSIGFFAGLAWLVSLLRDNIGNWSLILIIAVIFGFNPFKTNNRASDELVQYAKQYAGSYVIAPPFYDLTFLYHYDKQLFKGLKEKQQLHEFHIYPIYSLDEIDFDQLQRPIVLIDAGCQFVFGEQKLKNQLDQRLDLKTSQTFLGDYAVYVYE